MSSPDPQPPSISQPSNSSQPITTTTTTSSSSSTPPQQEHNPPPPSSRATLPFLPGNTPLTRFLNFTRMATGRMSPTGQTAYWTDADLRYEAIDCRRCESQRDHLLQFSPIIRFLGANIQQLGGTLDKSNIRCRRCEPHERMRGGFDPRFGIKLCANWLEGGRGVVEDTLAHEMVHAWDYLRWGVDFEGKGGKGGTVGVEEGLRQVACTEIRASSLSGECRWANEFFRNKIFRFTNHHQECVRRRAVLSVRSRPACQSDEHAVRLVNEVWESCFRDTRPFDEIFR